MHIECDSCERTIEIPVEHKGQKITCPYCGDVNRIPENESPAGAPPQTNAVREQTLCIVRPAMFRAHPFRFLLITLLLLGGIVLAMMAKTDERVPVWAVWPGLLAALIAGVWWFFWWMSAHLWEKLIVSNKRTIRHEGIVKRHTTEVLHDHVRSVDIQQSLLERILGVGTVGIDSAGQDHVEIIMRDIPKPYAVKEIIDQHRRM